MRAIRVDQLAGGLTVHLEDGYALNLTVDEGWELVDLLTGELDRRASALRASFPITDPPPVMDTAPEVWG